MDIQKVMVASIGFSERIRRLGESLPDCFITFSEKLRMFAPKKMAEIQEARIQFLGAPYNTSMHKAIVLLNQLEEDAQNVGIQNPTQMIKALELQFGRKESLAGSYSKIYRVLLAANKGAETGILGKSFAKTCAWLVKDMRLQLMTKRTTVKAWTLDAMAGTDKKGKSTPGFLKVSLTKLEAIEQVCKLLESAGERDPVLKKQVQSIISNYFESPDKFLEAFSIVTEMHVMCVGDDIMGEDVEENPENAVDELTKNTLEDIKKSSKVVGMGAEILHGLFAGMHDRDLTDLASGDLSAKAAFEQQNGAGGLGAAVRELCRVTTLSVDAAVEASGVAPKMGLLASSSMQAGGEDDDAAAAAELERQSLWCKTQAVRGKYVTFSAPKAAPATRPRNNNITNKHSNQPPLQIAALSLSNTRRAGQLMAWPRASELAGPSIGLWDQ